MLNYTPRPGSKTEAAVEYLRAHGGRATAIDIAEAIDTERKNLYATFAAAIGAGLIEACELADGAGYALCGATREWAAVPVPAASAAVPARRGRSVVDGDPAKAKRTPRAMAKRPRLPDAPEPRVAPRRVKASPPPVATPDEPFRCGFFSDGTLRLEGCNLLDGQVAQVTLSTAAAKVLATYLQAHKP